MTSLSDSEKTELTALFEMSMNRVVTVLENMEPYATELSKLDQNDLKGLQKLAATITWQDKCIVMEGILLGIAGVLEKRHIPGLKDYIQHFTSDKPKAEKSVIIIELSAEGKAKEAQFAALFEGATLATKEEDIYEHWDVKLPNGQTYDVKSMGRTHRHGPIDENFRWIEITNVLGDSGWLYGHAYGFAFEAQDYWILVEKHDLQQLVSRKCKNKTRTNNPWDALYKLYTRQGRDDLITQIKTLDLFTLPHTIKLKNPTLH